MNWLRNFFQKNKQASLIEVKLLDKNEHRALPEIPDWLVADCKNTQRVLDSHEGSSFEKLKYVYEFLNKFSLFAKSFSVCSNHCSACCKNDVQITTLEAKYIEKVSGKKAKNVRRPSNSHNSDCPFLKDNSCSIYETRPFNCRTLHTLDDPKYCSTHEHHQLYGLQGGKGIPIIFQFKKYTERLNENRPVADIRDFFS